MQWPMNAVMDIMNVECNEKNSTQSSEGNCSEICLHLNLNACL